MGSKYLDKYRVFVDAPEGQYSKIIEFVAKWFHSETDKLIPVKSDYFAYNGNKFSVYTSGYYFGCNGLVKIYERDCNTGKIFKKFA